MNISRFSTAFVCLLGCFFNRSHAQNVLILYSTPQDFRVCNTTQFSVTVTNNEPSVLATVSANIEFPAGVEYVPGSVSGAGPLNISNLQSPVFSMNNIEAGASATFTCLAKANCSLVGAINSGATFTNQITFNWAGGNKSATTIPYKIETPLLVFGTTSGLNLFGGVGDVRTRTFVVRNNRLGPLESFMFTDSYPAGGFTVSANVGDVVSNTGTFFKINLGADDFQQIGDGDGLFELNEEITIVETLTITDCGISINTSQSDISANWGCGTDQCQNLLIIAKVNIFQANVNPKLAFEPRHRVPVDQCGDKLTWQSILIKNTGNGPAQNAKITLRDNGRDVSGDFAALDSTAIQLVRSNGQKVKPAILNAQHDTLTDCPMPGTFGRIELQLPLLAAGDSAELWFGLRVCADDCEHFAESWEADFMLPLNCPPGTLDTAMGPIVGQTDRLPEYDNFLCIKKPLRDDETHAFQYALIANALRDSSGTLRVTFQLPCGMAWAGPALRLNGRSPSANGATQGSGGASERWFEFALPFAGDSVGGMASFQWDCDAPCLSDSCIYLFDNAACANACDVDPDSLPSARLGMVSEFLFDPDILPGCGPKLCGGFDLVYECGGDCDVSVSGYAEHATTFLRVSLGRADNDDNRLPDAAGALDFSKIRRDRFLPGDTSETVLRAVVRAGQAGATFDRAILRLFFESHGTDAGIDGGLAAEYNRPGDILEISRKLKVQDASSGQIFNCDLPPADTFWRLRNQYVTVNISDLSCLDSSDINRHMFFAYDVSPARLVAAGCPLPANFKYAEGDSLVLTARHRFMRAIDAPNVFNMRLKTMATVFNGNIQPTHPASGNGATVADFSCNCPYKFFQISGLQTRLSKIKIALPPCDPSDAPLQQQLDVLLGRGNFFPFEFRPVARVANWLNNVQAPVKLENQQVEFFRYQNGPNVLNNVPMLFTQNGDNYLLDVTNLAQIDEGFSIKLRQRFSAPCFLNQLRDFTSRVTLAWAAPLPLQNPGTVNVISTLQMQDTFGFIPQRPFLFASANVLNYVSPDNKGVWDVNFIHSGGSVPANNVWIYFENATGALTNFQVQAMPGGTPMPVLNGIFQLGDMQPGEVRQFRIIALNSSCEKETLTAFYGWNCTPVGSTTAQTCSRKTLTFTVTSQNSELELESATPTAAVSLCETSGYHEVRVFNALQGAAFGVQVQLQLPPGLAIAPGTCQIAYPTGTAWASIPDPTAAPGFGHGWSLADLNTSLAQNGLSGFGQAPANSATIRFRTITACGFINGSQIRYRSFGQQNCGDSTNVLVKPGQPVLLAGVPQPDEVQIALGPGVPLPVTCADEVPINLSFFGTAASGLRDSLFVTLPPGVAYLANSYMPGANAPTAQPTLATLGGRQILKWQLKNGVAANTPVALSFRAKNFGQSGCGVADTIFARTSQQQTATCVQTGSVCDVTALTGSAFTVIEVYRPQLSFLDFDVDFNAGIAAFRIKLKNNGTLLHTSPTIYKFYRDNDNSGSLTPGDVKKHEAAIFFPIAPGDVIDLAAGLPVDLADICHLVVVLEAADNCACQSVALPIDDIIRDIPDKTVCSGAFINLGVGPIPGHQYLWTPATGLECDTCSFPKFYLNNEDLAPVNITYTFTESAGDCSVTSVFTTTVLPMPRILNPDTTICGGETLVLTTTPAVSHEWFGNGISDPTAPTQTVTPLATSIYFVLIKDALDCQAIDTLTITVMPSSFAEIGPDTLGVCGNQPLQFDAFFNANYMYQWSPAGAVSDATIHNPFFTGTTSTTLVLTTNVPGSNCPDRDTVFVGFSQNPVLGISATSLANCFGDTAFVAMSGAQDYFWAPSAGVFCQNSACSSVGLMPEANTFYTIVGYNNFGCSDTVNLNVTVPGKIEKTTEQRTICSGETTSIFDIPVAQTGVFCKNFAGYTGCDSTHCVFLTVLDTPYLEQKGTLCPGTTLTIGGIAYDQPGRYCQTLPGANGCDSTACVIIETGTIPDLDTLYRATVAQGEPAPLDLPNGLATYEWSPTTYLSCADCADPIANGIPPTVDSLTYKITVTNAGGCTQVVTYRLRVLPPCDPANVIMPNAFTPGNDDLNELFRVPEREGLEQLLSLRLYNRWGEKVFETTNPAAEGWDGRDRKGKPLPNDVYVYILEIGCPDGTGGEKHGDFTLFR